MLHALQIHHCPVTVSFKAKLPKYLADDTSVVNDSDFLCDLSGKLNATVHRVDSLSFSMTVLFTFRLPSQVTSPYQRTTCGVLCSLASR